MIRSLKGVELGGTGTHLRKILIHKANNGDCVKVNFLFDCILAPGTYFISCGVGSLKNGEEIFHKMLDGAIFKVCNEKNIYHSGFINFNISPSIEKINSI